ncbi:MAG: hypothetical protein ACE5FH_10595 [Candidatus Zixiibacteriota bacterium]
MKIHECIPGRLGITPWSALLILLAFSSGASRVLSPKSELLLGRKKPGTSATATLTVEYTAHNRGNIQLAIANNGTFGTLGATIPDPFTGEAIPSCVYPKNSDLVYLWVAAIWIGAVVDRDTLVTTGNEDWYRTREFWSQRETAFDYESIDINDRFYSPTALSEQDIICEYVDVVDDPNLVGVDPTDNRAHKPLGIKVTQRSMAWSYEYADDFILFDYQIQSVTSKTLEDVYLGIYVDGDAWHTSRADPSGWNDDIVGFYQTHPAPEGCGFRDTINVAYHSDNDGDPEGGKFNEKSTRGVVGTRVVRTPAVDLQYSFNWWTIDYSNATRDFGPRQMGTPSDPFRRMGSRLGTPTGDRNKYYVMQHEEFDYDLMFTALNRSTQGWLQPPENAEDVADGYDCRYLLSFGPFRIRPGDRLPISFAWVGGENFHRDPNAFEELWDPKDPNKYYQQLNFDELAANARWASWVYDNPGVDTDNDGFAGKFRVCGFESTVVGFDTTIAGFDTIISPIWDYSRAETTFYEGDGVPDFRGAGPPPAPRVRIIPDVGNLRIRWNGFYSETTPDIFSRLIDFEGYRVYLGRDNRRGSLSVVASYDRENYNVYVFRMNGAGTYEWVIEDIPLTLDSLRSLYGDPEFDPLFYTRTRPLLIGDDSYFFAPQDFNQSDLNDPMGIRKAYPSATDPGTNPDHWIEDDLTSEHGEPLPRFYEYELTITDLLPTVPYYLSVTTFDFGSPVAGLPALETEPIGNAVREFAQPSAAEVASRQLDAYVYPNPYRADGAYKDRGFEDRAGVLSEDRRRRIFFANLPAKCTIRIYSIDGDMVREIIHDKEPHDFESSHDEWDLITRNTQAVVSGLYYFVIESDTRTQIGKLVIIK